MKRTLTYTQLKKIVLNETSRRQKAQHAFLGHMNNIKNFGIFSPENPMDNPEGLSHAENLERCNSFEKLLQRGNFIYHKIKGKYDSIEHSYMIYNINLEVLKDFGSEQMFNQESFFLCETIFDEGNRKTKVVFNYYKKAAPSKGFHLIETSEDYIRFDDEEALQYFSMIGRNFKFSIAMDEFGNKLNEANKMYESASRVMFDFNKILESSIKHFSKISWLRRIEIKKAIKEATERGLMPLDETSLSRLIGKHSNTGYIMISACRNSSLKGKTADEIKKQSEINNANTESLRNDIRSAGYSYIRVNGGYIERGEGEEDDIEVEEKSFIIFNFKQDDGNGWHSESNIDELKDFGIKMAMKYNQDSVLVVAPGEDPTYYTKDGSVDFTLSHNMAVNDLAQDFFTQLHKGNKRITFLPITAESIAHTINGLRSRKLRGELCVLG